MVDTRENHLPTSILTLYNRAAASFTIASNSGECEGNRGSQGRNRGNRYAVLFQAWLIGRISTVKFDTQARKLLSNTGHPASCLLCHSELMIRLLQLEEEGSRGIPVAPTKKILFCLLKVNRASRTQQQGPPAPEISSVDESAVALMNLAVETAVKNLLDGVLYRKWLPGRFPEAAVTFSPQISVADLRGFRGKHGWSQCPVEIVHTDGGFSPPGDQKSQSINQSINQSIE